jgi:hypothetical protein
MKSSASVFAVVSADSNVRANRWLGSPSTSASVRGFNNIHGLFLSIFPRHRTLQFVFARHLPAIKVGWLVFVLFSCATCVAVSGVACPAHPGQLVRSIAILLDWFIRFDRPLHWGAGVQALVFRRWCSGTGVQALVWLR